MASGGQEEAYAEIRDDEETHVQIIPHGGRQLRPPLRLEGRRSGREKGRTLCDL
jgi:hypothetical protein